MGYTVNRVNNEPIISIRMLAPLNPIEDLSNLYRETDAITADIQGTIYRIVDWSEAQLTFDLVNDLLDIQRKNTATTAPRSSRAKSFYIVASKWDRFNVESLRQPQYGGIEAPMFSTLDEALDAVHDFIKNETIELPQVGL